MSNFGRNNNFGCSNRKSETRRTHPLPKAMMWSNCISTKHCLGPDWGTTEFGRIVSWFHSLGSMALAFYICLPIAMVANYFSFVELPLIASYSYNCPLHWSLTFSSSDKQMYPWLQQLLSTNFQSPVHRLVSQDVVSGRLISLYFTSSSTSSLPRRHLW